MNEQQLVEQAKKGDSKAHGKLLSIVYPELKKVAYRNNKNKQLKIEIDDLVQHAACHLMQPKVIASYIPVEPWINYATIVATNAMKDYIRKERVRECISIDIPINEEGDTVKDLLVSHGLKPERYVELKEMAAIYDKVFPTLSPKQRIIISEIANESSFTEAARNVGMNIPTAKTHVHRAREELSLHL